MLEIQANDVGKAVVLHVAGRMDAETSVEFETTCVSWIDRGAKHLVVATDSAKELDTIMSLPKWTSQFQIIYVNETVTQPDGNKQVMDSLSNLYMLSETNYFVGFAHSNLARVAVDWIDAKNNLLAPVEWIEFELGQDGKQRSTDGRRTPLSSLYYAHYNHTAILEQVWCYRRHIAGLDMPPSHCK